MRVFVSSTIRDLEDVRAEVRTLLEELGLIPVLSNFPDSGFDPTVPGHKIKVCIDQVRNSELFLLILSQRYGSKCEDETDISMIHREYREAKKKGLRIIRFRREGLAEDFYKWEENEARPFEDYKYIQNEEWNKGLFKLIKECSEEVGDVEIEPLWYSFKYSTDLKRELAGILERYSGLAKMKKLSEMGSLPFFSSKLIQVKPDPSIENSFFVEFSYINVGTRPALNVKLGGDFRTVKGMVREFGDIQANQKEHHTIKFLKKPEGIDGVEPNRMILNFWFEFETFEQLTIRDWFNAEFVNGTCKITAQARLVKKELVKHDGWKITASEGGKGDTESE